MHICTYRNVMGRYSSELLIIAEYMEITVYEAIQKLMQNAEALRMPICTLIHEGSYLAVYCTTLDKLMGSDY